MVIHLVDRIYTYMAQPHRKNLQNQAGEMII